MTMEVASFNFPPRSKLEEFEREANRAQRAELEAALADAVARGHAEGFARGREEAQAEARALLEDSQREGLERGHAAGVDEMHAAADALRDALDAFNASRAKVVAEAEAFCVDLALSIVARMVDTDQVRTEFVQRSVQNAIKVLTPETPTAIFLSASDFKCVRSAMKDFPLHEDESLAPGSSRVEAGRLLIESSISEAFAQLRSAVLETKTKRTKPKSAAEKRDAV
jgi:flagellar biosynthesis/type III secretory pathway protein FliH